MSETTVTTEGVGEIQLRYLTPEDIEVVKHLCVDWFPIEYPDSWYQDITTSPRFFSLAATYNGNIVGLIVSEIKLRTKVHREDADILASSFPLDTYVAYILSLGVVKEFRNLGVGSLLLDSLMTHITNQNQERCKALYLHVLTTNTNAIRFYENRHFRQHHYLPYYYSIRGVLQDGFTYVLYLNGGHAPWTFMDYVQYVGAALASLRPCSLPHRLLQQAHRVVQRLISWRNLPPKPSATCHRTL
uniref:N-alpha-acetyltransferase 60 n=1 Tax=Myxine glutinosa TaxID=7769 RepID=UPI00358E0A8A